MLNLCDKSNLMNQVNRPSDIAAVILFCFVFIMPLCGTMSLLGFLGLFQVTFLAYVLIVYRKEFKSSISTYKDKNPYLMSLFMLWLLLTFISYILVMSTTELVWQIVGASARQFYIVGQTFFILALTLFLRVRGIELYRLFLVMAIGLMCILCFLLWLYNTEAYHDEWLWFFDPLLVVHMRDLGNIATVIAVTILTIYLLNTHYNHFQNFVLLLVLLTTWTFLLWSGGRMAVFSAAIVSLLILVMALTISKVSFYRVLLAFTFVMLSILLVEPISVFDWNGLTRSVATINIQSAESIVNDPAVINGLTTGRSTMWLMSISATMDSPIFGLGPYGYFFIPERTYGDQPHNLLVQFFVEWGIAGTLIVLLLLSGVGLAVLRQIVRAFSSRDQNYTCAVATVLVLTVHGLTGGTYFNVQPMFCLTLGFAGICLGPNYLVRSQSIKKAA